VDDHLKKDPLPLKNRSKIQSQFKANLAISPILTNIYGSSLDFKSFLSLFSLLDVFRSIVVFVRSSCKKEVQDYEPDGGLYGCKLLQRCELEWFMKADMLHMHLWLQKIIYLSSIANSRENPTNSGSSTISTVKNLLGWW